MEFYLVSKDTQELYQKTGGEISSEEFKVIYASRIYLEKYLDAFKKSIYMNLCEQQFIGRESDAYAQINILDKIMQSLQNMSPPSVYEEEFEKTQQIYKEALTK